MTWQENVDAAILLLGPKLVINGVRADDHISNSTIFIPREFQSNMSIFIAMHCIFQ